MESDLRSMHLSCIFDTSFWAFNGWIKELSIKIKEDNVIKFKLDKIKNHYLKEPPSGDLYVLGPSFRNM